MKHIEKLLFLPSVLVLCCGCQSMRTAGRRAGEIALKAPLFVAEGIVNGILDTDETLAQQEARENQEREWKQHWRDNPNTNRAMHEAFKDDYE
jgi:hypothetical protein